MDQATTCVYCLNCFGLIYNPFSCNVDISFVQDIDQTGNRRGFRLKSNLGTTNRFRGYLKILCHQLSLGFESKWIAYTDPICRNIPNCWMLLGLRMVKRSSSNESIQTQMKFRLELSFLREKRERIPEIAASQSWT